jgi:hypothetical protein
MSERNITSIRKDISINVPISQKDILNNMHSITENPLLIIAIIDNMFKHYSEELNAHNRYYLEFKSKYDLGDKTIENLMNWQLENKNALEALLTNLAEYRTNIGIVLKSIETFHRIRGWTSSLGWEYLGYK